MSSLHNLILLLMVHQRVRQAWEIIVNEQKSLHLLAQYCMLPGTRQGRGRQSLFLERKDINQPWHNALQFIEEHSQMLPHLFITTIT